MKTIINQFKPVEMGSWQFTTDGAFNLSQRWKFANDAKVWDKVAQRSISRSYFRCEIVDDGDGRFELTTCASHKSATRYRKFASYQEAVQVAYAWLNRRFSIMPTFNGIVSCDCGCKYYDDSNACIDCGLGVK